MTGEAERPIILGVIRGQSSSSLHLADVASREPGIIVRAATFSDDVDAVIVDASIEERAELLRSARLRRPVPVLVESPIAADAQRAEQLASEFRDGADLVAVNPLRFALH